MVLLAVRDKPLSGVDNIEWTRASADGSVITTRLEAPLARDSQGRTYRENHSKVPGGSSDRAPLNYIHIADPTTRTQMTCYPKTFVCRLSDYAPRTFFNPSPIGSIDNGTRYRTLEDLGSDQFEGLEVFKSKEVTTTRAGVVGNDRDIVDTREFWYSESLQTNLKTMRTGPFLSKQLIYVSNISLSEPNPQLFKVPIGYSVLDERLRKHN